MENDGKCAGSLRIDRIGIYRFDIPLREPMKIATMETRSAPNVLVRIGTDGGIEGWGEASPLHAIVGETQETCLAAAREIRPLLLSCDPRETAALAAVMERFLPHNTTVRSAFDMALHDVAARAAGLPLYRLLGGRRRSMETDLTIFIGDPDAAGDKALRVLERGFRIIKTKVGVSLEDDLRRLGNIRKAVGMGPGLRIDANQGWRRMEAVRFLEAMGNLKIEFCEQPVRARDLEGLRFVSDRSPVPVMADEALFSASDALRIIGLGAAPYFNITLSKSGGIREAGTIARIAEASGVPCMMGCMLESRLGISAAAHFALAHEAVTFFDLDSFYDHAADPIAGGATVRDGMVEVPEEPGLGAVPDPAFLKTLVEIP